MMTMLCVWRLVRMINEKYHWSCCNCGYIKPLVLHIGQKNLVILDASLGQVGTPLMFLPTSNLYIPFSRWWRCLRSQQRSQSWQRFRYPPQHHVSRHKEAAQSCSRHGEHSVCWCPALHTGTQMASSEAVNGHDKHRVLWKTPRCHTNTWSVNG